MEFILTSDSKLIDRSDVAKFALINFENYATHTVEEVTNLTTVETVDSDGVTVWFEFNPLATRCAHCSDLGIVEGYCSEVWEVETETFKVFEVLEV